MPPLHYQPPQISFHHDTVEPRSLGPTKTYSDFAGHAIGKPVGWNPPFSRGQIAAKTIEFGRNMMREDKMEEDMILCDYVM